jgi:hypothetical protein
MIACNPFQTTKNTLESNNQTQLAALTREEILGDMMISHKKDTGVSFL